MGVLSRPGGGRAENRGTVSVVEAPRVVVDEPHGRLAVLGGMAVGGVRLQRGAVFPELLRGARRGLRSTRAAPPLRRARASALGRPGALGPVAAGGSGRRRPGRMDRADGILRRRIMPRPGPNAPSPLSVFNDLDYAVRRQSTILAAREL